MGRGMGGWVWAGALLCAACGRLPPMDARVACTASAQCAQGEFCAPDGVCWRPPLVAPRAPVWVGAEFGPGRAARLELALPSSVDTTDLYLKERGSERLLGSTSSTVWEGLLPAGLNPTFPVVARSVRGGQEGQPSAELPIYGGRTLLLASREGTPPWAEIVLTYDDQPLSCWDSALLIERARPGGAFEKGLLRNDPFNKCLVRLEGESTWRLRASLRKSALAVVRSAEVVQSILGIAPPDPPPGFVARCVEGGDRLTWSAPPKADQFEILDRYGNALARLGSDAREFFVACPPSQCWGSNYYGIRSLDRGVAGASVTAYSAFRLGPPAVTAKSGAAGIRLSWSGGTELTKVAAAHLNPPLYASGTSTVVDPTAPLLTPTSYTVSSIDAGGCEGRWEKSLQAVRTGPAEVEFLGTGATLTRTVVSGAVGQALAAGSGGRLRAIELDLALTSFNPGGIAVAVYDANGLRLASGYASPLYQGSFDAQPLTSGEVRGTLLDLSPLGLDVAPGARLQVVAGSPTTTQFAVALAPDLYPDGAASLNGGVVGGDIPFRLFVTASSTPGAPPEEAP